MREIFFLTFKAHGPHCVPSIRHACQHKYFLVWTLRSVNKSILLTGLYLEIRSPIFFVRPELAIWPYIYVYIYGLIIWQHQVLNKNNFQTRRTHYVMMYVILISSQLVCAVLKCPKVRQNKLFSDFEHFRCQNSVKLKSGQFSAKVKKAVPYRIIRTGY